MQPPPATLDGARVLKVADLASARATSRTRHYVGNERVTEFACIALAQYADEPGVYLFYCGPDWSVITDTLHADLADAEEQARREFDGIELVDVAPSS